MRSRFESVVTLPNRRSRRPGAALLLQRDCGRQAFDRIDVGHRHLLKEAPGVRGDRLQVAALRFGVERRERQRRLARAGDAAEDHQRVARDIDVDILEVVDACAPDVDHAAFAVRDWKFRRSHASNYASE